MDPQKTGQFICILRKQRGLTQRELAEAVGVTDKAVSRWERGRGLPDVSLLSPLAAALGTSVTELLAGEPLTAEERGARSDSVLLEALRYTGSMGRKTAVLLTALAGVSAAPAPVHRGPAPGPPPDRRGTAGPGSAPRQGPPARFPGGLAAGSVGAAGPPLHGAGSDGGIFRGGPWAGADPLRRSDALRVSGDRKSVV